MDRVDTADLAREARTVLGRLEATYARLADKELRMRELTNTLADMEEAVKDLMEIRDEDEYTLSELRDELEQVGYGDAELMEEIDDVLAVSPVHGTAGEVEID